MVRPRERRVVSRQRREIHVAQEFSVKRRAGRRVHDRVCARKRVLRDSVAFSARGHGRSCQKTFAKTAGER